MTLYVFERVERLTHSYHSEGGLVVVAGDDAHARRLIAAEVEGPHVVDPDGRSSASEQHPHLTDEEWEKVIRYPLAGTHDAKVFVFPDAGCC